MIIVSATMTPTTMRTISTSATATVRTVSTQGWTIVMKRVMKTTAVPVKQKSTPSGCTRLKKIPSLILSIMSMWMVLLTIMAPSASKICASCLAMRPSAGSVFAMPTSIASVMVLSPVWPQSRTRRRLVGTKIMP